MPEVDVETVEAKLHTQKIIRVMVEPVVPFWEAACRIVLDREEVREWL